MRNIIEISGYRQEGAINELQALALQHYLHNLHMGFY